MSLPEKNDGKKNDGYSYKAQKERKKDRGKERAGKKLNLSVEGRQQKKGSAPARGREVLGSLYLLI